MRNSARPTPKRLLSNCPRILVPCGYCQAMRERTPTQPRTIIRNDHRKISFGFHRGWSDLPITPRASDDLGGGCKWAAITRVVLDLRSSLNLHGSGTILELSYAAVYQVSALHCRGARVQRLVRPTFPVPSVRVAPRVLCRCIYRRTVDGSSSVSTPRLEAYVRPIKIRLATSRCSVLACHAANVNPPRGLRLLT